MTHLINVGCQRCRKAPAMAAPGQEAGAMCMTCAREVAGIDWEWLVPHGDWHPTTGYGSPGLGGSRAILEPKGFPAPDFVGSVGGVGVLDSPPSAITSLARYAGEHDWGVKAQYSRGHFPHAKTGRPTALRHVYSLRFGGHPLVARQAYAVYARSVSGGTWSWDQVWIWGPGLAPFSGLSVTDLRLYLSCYLHQDDSALLDSWIEDVKLVRSSSLLAARNVACPGAPLCELPKETHSHRANGDIRPKKAKEAVQGA